VTSVGWISSIYTSWPIQTLLPITTPRDRCNHGRKLNPPGARKAILPASLPSRGGNFTGFHLSFVISGVSEMSEIECLSFSCERTLTAPKIASPHPHSHELRPRETILPHPLSPSRYIVTSCDRCQQPARPKSSPMSQPPRLQESRP
jgi:hypothetical protein